MNKILFPILAAIALLAASVSADDTSVSPSYHPVPSVQLRKSAERGNPNAQCDLGRMYRYGIGVKKDYAEAVKWYRKAAEQGFAEAQFNLGLMCQYGRGVEKDDAHALRWLRKSAEQGYAEAQFNLGLMCQYGQGVEKDYAEAVKWYRKSAEQRYAKAQYYLGLMYANGRGVEKDYAEAYAWFNLAAANVNEGAGKSRNELEKKMSPQQAANAQKRTKELKKLIADKKPTGVPPKTSN